jgi:hypothetical protein
MAGDNAKVIKFSYSHDEQSARALVRSFETIKRSLEGVVSTAQRATAALGGIGGPGVTSNKFTPGVRGGSAFQNTPVAQKQAGIVAQVFGGDAASIKNLASTTQQAFAGASTGIRSFVQRAETDLKRLQRTIEGVGGALRGIAPPSWGGGGGGMGGGGGSRLLGPMGGGGGTPFIPEYIPPGGRGGGFGGGGRGPRMLGPVGGFGGGGGGVPPGGGGGGFPFPGGFGALLGGLGLGFFGASTLVGGAMGAYNFGARAYDKNREANLGYQVNELGGDRLARQAQVAAPFVEQYQQARSGNLSYLMARKQVLRSAAHTAMMDPKNREELMQRLAGTKGANLGVAKNWISSFAGKALAGTGKDPGGSTKFNADPNWDKNLPPGGMDILEEITTRKMSAAQADAYRANIANTMALQGPRLRAISENMVGQAQGNVSLRRAGFYGVPKGRDPMEYMLERRANLTAQGYSTEEEAGARRSIVTGAGMGYLSRFGGTELLGMQNGGLNNAVDLARTGGILGGSSGAGMNFLRKTVQGSLGRGGLDVTAGSQLFGDLSSRALASGQFGAGNTFSTYAGAAAGLVGGGAGAPLDVAEQQRRAGMLSAGMATFGGFTSGAAAPLYQMTSLLGATQAAGGYGASSEALSRMSPEVLTAISRGGAVPEWARGLGVDKGSASKFLDYQRKAPLFEVVDEMIGGDAGDLLKKVRGAEADGGSFMDVVKGETKGLKGASRARRATQIAEQLGGVLYSQGLASSPEAGAGVFEAQMLQDEGMAPGLRARGAHGVGPQGSEKEALAVQSKQLMADSKLMADNIGELTKLMKELFGVSKAGEEATNFLGSTPLEGNSAAGEAGQFANALKIASAAADRYARAEIKKAANGPVKAR